MENTRFVPAAVAGLDAADVPRLAVKWVFAYPGASRARSQPSVWGGVVYVGSQDGTVYALDLDSGCAHWTFKADVEVRSAITADESGKRLFFGDIRGTLYAVDSADGGFIWRTQVDKHPDVTLTGSPRYHQGRVYAPLSSKEWASAADPGYPCCTFRGGVTAVDASDGRILWTARSIAEEPVPVGRNATGLQRFAPAGAPIWNSPTLDPRRGWLYAGTGESYTSPARRHQRRGAGVRPEIGPSGLVPPSPGRGCLEHGLLHRRRRELPGGKRPRPRHRRPTHVGAAR